MTFKIANRVSITLLAIFFLIDWLITPLSIWYYLIVILAYFCLISYGSAKIDSQFYLPVKIKATDPQNAVALTFDDGPNPVLTPQLIKILAEHNAPAAFFCIGRNIEKHPEIVQKLDQEGHLIGNHSYHHGAMFDFQSFKKIKADLSRNDKLIEKTIGKRSMFFRPPYGVTNPNVARAIREGKYVPVGWSLRSLDTLINDEKRLASRVIKKIRPGDILLFHDFCSVLPAVLPIILKHITKSGLKIVRVDELIHEKPYA